MNCHLATSWGSNKSPEPQWRTTMNSRPFGLIDSHLNVVGCVNTRLLIHPHWLRHIKRNREKGTVLISLLNMMPVTVGNFAFRLVDHSVQSLGKKPLIFLGIRIYNTTSMFYPKLLGKLESLLVHRFQLEVYKYWLSIYIATEITGKLIAKW